MFRYVSEDGLKNLISSWKNDLSHEPNRVPQLKPHRRFIFLNNSWEKETSDIKAYDSAFFGFAEPVPHDWCRSPFEENALHNFFHNNLAYGRFYCLRIDVRPEDDAYYTDVSVFRNKDGSFRTDGNLAYKDYFNTLSSFHHPKPDHYQLHEVACFSSIPITRMDVYATFDQSDVSDYISNHERFTNRPPKRIYTPAS